MDAIAARAVKGLVLKIAAALVSLTVGGADAVELDPSAQCIVHVRRGEQAQLPPWIKLEIDASGMRRDQIMWCIDEGAILGDGASLK